MYIITEDQYNIALKRVEDLFNLNPAKDSPEGFELEHLIDLIEAYEDFHYRNHPFVQSH